MFFSLSPIVGNCKNETEWKIRKKFEDAKRSIERRELTRIDKEGGVEFGWKVGDRRER